MRCDDQGLWLLLLGREELCQVSVALQPFETTARVNAIQHRDRTSGTAVTGPCWHFGTISEILECGAEI